MVCVKLVPNLTPLEPDTMLNCLPAFVTFEDPVAVIESSVSFSVFEFKVVVRFKDPGFKLCLYLALLMFIT